MRIVDSILADKDWRARAWYLERTASDEFARPVERIERIGEPADDKKVSLQIYYNNDQPLSELLAFPIHKSMGQGHDSPKVAREKQRRLAGDFDATEKAPVQPEPETISDAPAPKETISNAAAAQVVDKRLTGRIPDHWKDNNGK